MTVIRRVRGLTAAAIVVSVTGVAPISVAAQSPNETIKAAPVERLGPNLLRIGTIHVDTAKQEVSVKGVVNDVEVLEFIANPKGGAKAYESAIELDTDAVNFNLGLILIGLDHTHTKWPRRGDPPMLPNGDPVDIFVEWTAGDKPRRIRAEQLVYNEVAKTTLPEGPWVYTGSVFLPENNAFLADLNGALIGFVHRGAPVIDSPRPLPQGPYESNRLNPALNLKPGTSVTLIVKALPREKR
jgi:hypothetical protein